MAGNNHFHPFQTGCLGFQVHRRSWVNKTTVEWPAAKVIPEQFPEFSCFACIGIWKKW